jgi:hypothetical protein
MVCFAAWPLFRERGTILAAYIGNNIAFALHYALLGHWTAVAMNGLMLVQTVVALRLVREPRWRLAYYALMPALVLAGILTWEGVPSLLSGAATAFSTLGRMQTRNAALRILLLAATPFWAAHDVIVGSIPGLAADLLNLATGTITLLWRAEALSPRAATATAAGADARPGAATAARSPARGTAGPARAEPRARGTW